MCEHVAVWYDDGVQDHDGVQDRVIHTKISTVAWLYCLQCASTAPEGFKPNKQTCKVCGHLSLSYECKHMCAEIAKTVDFIDEN